MIEDEWLKLRFRRGSREALRRIYEKYLDFLLTLAMALLHDRAEAEDIVHDTFLALAKSVEGFRSRGNLKSFLATCVVNRARDRIRARQRHAAKLPDVAPCPGASTEPSQTSISTEESERISDAVARIPQPQREVIVLRLKAQMTFKEIALLQGTSLNTVQGRYRYGLEKLRSLLNGRVEP